MRAGAPPLPLWLVKTGALSSTGVTVTVSARVSMSVPSLTCTTTPWTCPPPAANGASASGATTKRSAPVAASMAKRAASAPPTIDQVSAVVDWSTSLPVSVVTTLLFSATS